MTSTHRLHRPAVSHPGESLALASPDCQKCDGVGIEPSGSRCECVYRAIFRICLRQFRASVSETFPRSTAGYKSQEFAADFCLIARRILRNSFIESRIFNFHFLLGAHSALCARRLQLTRASFYYRRAILEAKLGRAFAETSPYPLFPIDEYFSCSIPR